MAERNKVGRETKKPALKDIEETRREKKEKEQHKHSS